MQRGRDWSGEAGRPDRIVMRGDYCRATDFRVSKINPDATLNPRGDGRTRLGYEAHSGEAAVGELAASNAMSLPGVSKHMKVLSKTGLVVESRDAQRRPCRLDAPRELVFQGWIDPVHLQWFANPSHSRLPITIDLRVGGAWRLQMIENEDKAYMTGGIYREIVAPEKLVFSWGAVDGWPAIYPNKFDDVPVIIVTLNDLCDATEMIFHVAFLGHFSDADVESWFAMGISDGWTQTIDRLNPYLRFSRT